jgi:phospholipase/carboxylesterase
MRETTLAGLKIRITGGSDREGGGDGPLVVLLHGFGAPGDDLVPLWRQLAAPPGTRFAFPEAPLELELGMPSGLGSPRAWWMIDVAALERAMARGELRDMSRQTPEGLPEASAQIAELLSLLETELSVPSGQLVIGGFSQGAMLSADVALRSERALAGLVVLSGTLLSEPDWVSLMPKRKGLPVLQSHGRADPLLPFALAERLRDLLREAGLDVTWLPFNGGHGIAPGVLDELGPFIARATKAGAVNRS